MKEQTYIRIADWYAKHPVAAKATTLANKAIVTCCYALYPLLVVLTFTNQPAFEAAKTVIVPALSFAAVTVFRKWKNAPRPYERYNVASLDGKTTAGNSFPSRHVFSIFVIAVSWYRFAPEAGLALMAAGCVLAALRVLMADHFPEDVVSGALLGMACTSVLYVLVP